MVVAATAMTTLCVSVGMAVPAGAQPASAQAQSQSQAQARSQTTSNAQDSGTSSSHTVVPAAATPHQQATVSIDSATPVVTSNSGYHFKATVTNTSGATLQAGVLRVATSDLYTFISRTDFQSWSQETTHIPTPDELGRANVPQLRRGATVKVSIDAAPDQPSLKAMTSWGPKPVFADYHSGAGQDGDAALGADSLKAGIRTFLTRSEDGLQTAQTPPMRLTVAMPLTSTDWKVDDGKLSGFLADGKDSSGILNSDGGADGSSDGSTSDTNGQTDKNTQPSIRLLASRHSKLQVLTDPAWAKATGSAPHSDGVIQPGDFDITTYAAHGNPDAYRNAGIDAHSWDAKTSVEQWRSVSGDTNSQPTAYAWQGDANWTAEALNTAKAQGYSTVISESGFGDDSSSAAHTGKYEVPTDSGDITVLSAQKELTLLAQGKPTSRNADGEATAAGRLSRFMAQSAFYQMELPYANRNLLVCLSPEVPTKQSESLLQGMEQASWLDLTDINTLNKEKPYLSGDDAVSAVSETTGMSSAAQHRIDRSLASLNSSRSSITRFGNDILDESSKSTGSSTNTGTGTKSSGSKNKGKTGGSQTGGGTAGKESSGDSDGSDSTADSQSGKNDTQSLARQDASDTVKRPQNSQSWISTIDELHNTLALYALSPDESMSTRLASSADNLAGQLLGSVTITPSEPVTVVSQSANMPVTVSNKNPYPVQVTISSLTNSMEIVTERSKQLSVPAHGEVQTTFAIRVATSGSATAHLSLLDRGKEAFSQPQYTQINSTLRISDVAGWIFVAFALVLGVWGLWRQFNRKKDPDE